MQLELKWFDKEFDGYYVAGAIFNGFSAQEATGNLEKYIQDAKDVFVTFEQLGDVLTVKSITDEEPLEDSYYYELDEEILELFETFKKDKDIIYIVCVLAVQYFEFDTLSEILEFSPEEIEALEGEDKMVIVNIRKELDKMSAKEKEEFLENELFFYEKEELENLIKQYN